MLLHASAGNAAGPALPVRSWHHYMCGGDAHHQVADPKSGCASAQRAGSTCSAGRVTGGHRPGAPPAAATVSGATDVRSSLIMLKVARNVAGELRSALAAVAAAPATSVGRQLAQCGAIAPYPFRSSSPSVICRFPFYSEWRADPRVAFQAQKVGEDANCAVRRISTSPCLRLLLPLYRSAQLWSRGAVPGWHSHRHVAPHFHAARPGAGPGCSGDR